MFKITEQERKNILLSHLKEKLNEQQAKAQPKDILPSFSSIAKNIFDKGMCFCNNKKTVCNNITVYNRKNYIIATAITNSTSVDKDLKPIYKQGDTIYFNIDDYTFTVGNIDSGLKHFWSCAELNDQIIVPNLAKILNYYKQIGYFLLKELESLGIKADALDNYTEYSLKAAYPYLFPPNTKDIILYKPKSEEFMTKQASLPATQEQQARIDAYKQKNPNLKTKEEAMAEMNVSDFEQIRNQYKEYRIGEPGDNVFNRDFFLYEKISGQESAKSAAQGAREAVKEMNINKPTCTKLINNFYDMYKVNQTNLPEAQFTTLREKVVYCSKKYDNYGLFGGDSVDKKIAQLRSLRTGNKFKI